MSFYGLETSKVLRTEAKTGCDGMLLSVVVLLIMVPFGAPADPDNVALSREVWVGTGASSSGQLLSIYSLLVIHGLHAQPPRLLGLAILLLIVSVLYVLSPLLLYTWLMAKCTSSIYLCEYYLS